MIKFTLVLFAIGSSLSSQILPTIPKNVFRFSTGYEHTTGEWSLSDQNFNLNGIGRRYFNHQIYDENGVYNSNHDLYYLGSTKIDSNNTFDLNHMGADILDTALTVEEWLIKFNDYYGFNLPTLGEQNIDTNSEIFIKGFFDEKRKRDFFGKTYKIEYGMSDEITLSISTSIIDNFIINQNFSNYNVGKIDNVEDLINYHIETKSALKNFIESNTFSNLNRDVRSTLNMIYDYYYRNNSPFSVNWVFHSLDDPINNLILDDKMKPLELMDDDTVSIEELIQYYYPKRKISSGVDDISLSITVLLNGNPAWRTINKDNAIYAKFKLSIPYGTTISSYKSNGFGKKQFKQANIGSGAFGWGFGFLFERKRKSKNNSRVFISSMIQFNSHATLNTPVQFFSGGHSNPDSVLSYIGNTYKLKEGLILDAQLGGETEIVKNRLILKYNLNFRNKNKDQYISNSIDWNQWMESHDGYSSAYKFFKIGSEFWIVNSISKNKIGPFSFDIYGGFNYSILAENNYVENRFYGGITTYFQGW